MKNFDDKSIVLDLNIKDDSYDFAFDITSELAKSEIELQTIDSQLSETEEKLKILTPECDKLDYTLAATSGVICGIIDVFLVGKPGESPLGEITDKWFENRTIDFANLCGWENNGSASSAISFLEKKFKVPYDQRGAGDAGSAIFNLTPSNHHFKSLAHNPTLLGLFFSILDQFTNSSHFVSEGELISLVGADDSFELRGNTVISKFFCAIVNWFGHLMSDVSGSSQSKGRGMGIPSPLCSWTNDIIAIKRKLKIPVSEFDKSTNELALKIFNQGYDVRFRTTQAIPVIINEFVVRFIYSIRRLISYFSVTPKEERSFKALWKSCEPFTNATVKRMITVAHGSFCLVDIGDATIRGFAMGGGTFNVVEFVLRLNIDGVEKFAISLYGEARSANKRAFLNEEIYYLSRKRSVLTYYVDGLKQLADIYDDRDLVNFVDDLKKSDMYKEAFQKTVKLAEKRNVPADKYLKNKSDIDAFFMGKKG